MADISRAGRASGAAGGPWADEVIIRGAAAPDKQKPRGPRGSSSAHTFMGDCDGGPTSPPSAAGRGRPRATPGPGGASPEARARGVSAAGRALPGAAFHAPIVVRLPAPATLA